jgi:hypothetical protein
MSARLVFNFELGIDTESWCAELALRSLVSMSATGSVMVMVLLFSLAGFDSGDTRADLVS